MLDEMISFAISTFELRLILPESVILEYEAYSYDVIAVVKVSRATCREQ